MAIINLLDTHIVLYYLAGRLEKPLPSSEYCVSVITEIELLSYPRLDERSKNQIESFLDKLTIINLEEEIKERTIELRKKFSIKIPDAIIGATALYLNADLISNDVCFQRIPHLTCHPFPIKN